jgi:hypothetical protein
LQISHCCNSNTKKEHTKGELDVPTAEFSQKHDKMIIIILHRGHYDQDTNLNFFLKKRVSKITVQGMMASFVIWSKRAFLA